MNKAIFLDRDGVINEDIGYLGRIEDCKFIPGVFASLKKTNSKYKLVVVTNQAGIAKEKFTVDDYNALTAWIRKQMEENGVEISQIYHCPHHPKAPLEEYRKECSWRKPNPGMFLKAAEEHDIDLSKSYLIGDKTSDILAGKNAGCKTILVETGYAGEDGVCDIKADYVVADINAAVDLVLRNL